MTIPLLTRGAEDAMKAHPPYPVSLTHTPAAV